MIGLALEGGGTKGSYQIGAYYAMKDCGITFDGFCGTSIGSFNSAMLACGKEKELLEFWQNVNIATVLGFDPNYINKINKREIDLSFFKMSLKGAMRMLKNRGVDTDGLEKVLQEHVNEEELRNSQKDYGLCTVKVNKLQPCYLFKEDMKPGTIHDYILASCFLPLFRMKKTANNEYYIDGGFYDNSPVNMLIDKGYTKVYVVRVNIGLSINITRRLKKDIDVTYIKPSRNVGTILELNDEKVHDNIQMGYYDTLRVLRNLDGYVYTFKRKKESYFEWIARNVEERKKRRVKNFFHTKSDKETVIKALEYIMTKEKIYYYQIYKLPKVLHYVKKHYKKSHFVYDFIRELRFL
ncbi:MAG: patatin-like phospholipase family protein [Bacilli bacterium]|nr:patatin-like phospholipase family protein [Bacilli bacterium]